VGHVPDTRKVVGETGSDLARIHRQQLVLSAILRQLTGAGTLLDPRANWATSSKPS